MACISCKARCNGKKPPPVQPSAYPHSVSIGSSAGTDQEVSPLKLKQLQSSPIPPIKEQSNEEDSIPLAVASSAPDVVPSNDKNNEPGNPNSEPIDEDNPDPQTPPAQVFIL